MRVRVKAFVARADRHRGAQRLDWCTLFMVVTTSGISCSREERGVQLAAECARGIEQIAVWHAQGLELALQ
jgi:hypothetical protein